MKKIVALEDAMIPPSGEDKSEKPTTRREVLRLIGNIKADTADDSRRIHRILKKLRDKAQNDLILDNDDMHFLEKTFEKNGMELRAWSQGQILDLIDSAERVDNTPQVV